MRPPALFVFAVTASLLLSAIPERAPAAGTDDARLLTELDRSDSEDRRREICQEILRNRPQPYARDFCEGYEALVAGRDAEADQLLEASLAARPDFALACILYGRTVEARGQSERAAAYYRRAIELQPDRTDSRFALGSLLFRRGTTEDPSYLPQALEAFRRMTEEDPASPNGWSSMGAVLAHLGRFADAEEMYRKAIERDRNDPALHDNLAALYLRWGKEEEAQKAWERTLSLNRGYGHAVIELAALHGRSGRLVEAVRTLEGGRSAVQAPPLGPRIRRTLGFVYLQLGDQNLAMERFREAIAAGSDALASLGLGHMLMLRQVLQEALPFLETGASRDAALAVPFVAAWAARIQPAISAGSAPHLTRVLAQVSTSGAAADSVLQGARGAEASTALVSFALPGWNFNNAEEALASVRADSTAGGIDVAPVPIKQVAAEYPESAQEAGMTGTVHIEVTIDAKGKVKNAVIADCQAAPILCESARAAARQWEFEPAKRYGRPYETTVVLPFRFSN